MLGDSNSRREDVYLFGVDVAWKYCINCTAYETVDFEIRVCVCVCVCVCARACAFPLSHSRSLRRDVGL